jgi:hypothetical protein
VTGRRGQRGGSTGDREPEQRPIERLVAAWRIVTLGSALALLAIAGSAGEKSEGNLRFERRQLFVGPYENAAVDCAGDTRR